MSRKLAEALGARLKVPVIVDNKPGANGAIGAAEVARAQPDGYTLMVTISDPLVSTPATIKVSYDPQRDFVAVTKIATSAPVMVVHSSRKSSALADVVAVSKVAKGAAAYYGSFGLGSFPQLVMESINRQAKAEFREINYKGAPSALQDLLGNQIGVAFTSASQAAQLATEGKVKVVAIMGQKRSPLLPNVPTFVEAGYDNFAVRRLSWLGMLGPAKLPPEIRVRLAAAVKAVVAEPEFVKWMSTTDFGPVGSTPAEFERDLTSEHRVVTKFIRDELKLQPN